MKNSLEQLRAYIFDYFSIICWVISLMLTPKDQGSHNLVTTIHFWSQVLSAFFRCYPEKMEWECKDNTYRMTGGWQVPEFLRFNRLDNSWLISDLLCDVKNCAGQRISDREMNETKAPRKPLKRNLLEINGFHIHFSFARGFILSFPSLFHFGSEINCLDQLSIVFQLISGRLLPG